MKVKLPIAVLITAAVALGNVQALAQDPLTSASGNSTSGNSTSGNASSGSSGNTSTNLNGSSSFQPTESPVNPAANLTAKAAN